jgi:predicted HAD superfamily Cof-like phosphohydrolase
MRMRLIDEEMQELRNGVSDRDIENVAKELADILYVVYGAAITWGINIDQVFDIVHEDNMRKVWRSSELGELAGMGVTNYQLKPIRVWDDGIGVERFIVYRSDGKVLKPPSWEASDLAVALTEGVGENEKEFDHGVTTSNLDGG